MSRRQPLQVHHVVTIRRRALLPLGRCNERLPIELNCEFTGWLFSAYFPPLSGRLVAHGLNPLAVPGEHGLDLLVEDGDRGVLEAHVLSHLHELVRQGNVVVTLLVRLDVDHHCSRL